MKDQCSNRPTARFHESTEESVTSSARQEGWVTLIQFSSRSMNSAILTYEVETSLLLLHLQLTAFTVHQNSFFFF